MTTMEAAAINDKGNSTTSSRVGGTESMLKGKTLVLNENKNLTILPLVQCLKDSLSSLKKKQKMKSSPPSSSSSLWTSYLPRFFQWPIIKCIYRMISLRWTCFLLGQLAAGLLPSHAHSIPSKFSWYTYLFPSQVLMVHLLSKGIEHQQRSLIATTVEQQDEISVYLAMKLIELIASIDMTVWTWTSLIDLLVSLYLSVKAKALPELILVKYVFQDAVYLLEQAVLVMNGEITLRELQGDEEHKEENREQRIPNNTTLKNKNSSSGILKVDSVIVVDHDDDNRLDSLSTSSLSVSSLSFSSVSSSTTSSAWFVGTLVYVVYLLMLMVQLCQPQSEPLTILSSPTTSIGSSSSSSSESRIVGKSISPVIALIAELCQCTPTSYSTSASASASAAPSGSTNGVNGCSGAPSTFVIFCYLNVIFCVGMIVIGIYQIMTPTMKKRLR